MTAAIETASLSKRFRRRLAVGSIDLAVPAGSLFGYLGPNGAGKTTTIRMLLGLARPTAGRARVLGRDVPGGLAVVRHRVGSMLENPAFYPRMSARGNLRMLGRVAGDEHADSRIDALLDRVGLADRAGDKVAGYSHGMRQRLGLAAALLHDPEVLILDEPATALDPSGIRAVRALLGTLREEGRTVFLSSHLLSEVEQLCDHVAVVRAGAVVYQGTLAGLTAGGERVRVEVAETDAAESVLGTLGWIVERDGDALVVSGATAGEVNRALAERGIYAHGLASSARRLEEVFLEITEDHA